MGHTHAVDERDAQATFTSGAIFADRYVVDGLLGEGDR